MKGFDMTEGQYRVGIDFNPSGDDYVNQIAATKKERQQ